MPARRAVVVLRWLACGWGGQSKSVSDAVHMLVDHIFKNNGSHSSHSHGGPALLQGRGPMLGEEAMDEWYGWDQQPHAQQHRGAR